LENQIYKIAILFFSSIITSFFISKSIIYISKERKLFDEVGNQRKIHTNLTPNIGGVSLFFSLLVCVHFFNLTEILINWNLIEFSLIIIFLIGLKDDLVGMGPYKKLVTQIFVAIYLSYYSVYKFNSLYGIFNIFDLSILISTFITTLFYIFIINSINLIDGIDTLASNICLTAISILAYLFFTLGDISTFYLCILIIGSLFSFLYFNFSPAKLFMGDSGSLFLGLLVSILSIRFLEKNYSNNLNNLFYYKSSVGIVFSILIIPIFDTTRVFIVRIWNKKSPFKPDRNHLHHFLLDLGLSHVKSSLLLTFITFLSTIILVYFDKIISFHAITLVAIIYFLFMLFIYLKKNK
jgi:UDP-GlcNAc:undecaprenyl-phosphate GlcNAc-1-phosphate transferase